MRSLLFVKTFDESTIDGTTIVTASALREKILSVTVQVPRL